MSTRVIPLRSGSKMFTPHPLHAWPRNRIPGFPLGRPSSRSARCRSLLLLSVVVHVNDGAGSAGGNRRAGAIAVVVLVLVRLPAPIHHSSKRLNGADDGPFLGAILRERLPVPILPVEKFPVPRAHSAEC